MLIQRTWTHTARLAALGLALASLAGGCDRDDRALKAVEKAQQSIAVLTSEGSALPYSDGDRRAKLQGIVDSMRGIPETSPIKASAQGVAGRARAALANLDATAAVAANQTLSNRLSALRTTLDSWVSSSAVASSLSGYDAAKESAPLRTSMTQVTAAETKAKADAGKAQQAMSALQATITSKTTEAKAKREQATSLKARMQGVSQVEGLALIEQSAAARTEADRLDTEATELTVQLGVARREAEQASGRATALADERARLQAEIEEVQAKGQRNAKLASDASAAAAAAGKDIAAQVKDLETFRAGALEPAHKKAVTGAREVVGLMKESAKAVGIDTGAGAKDALAAANTGKIGVATAQQTCADVLVNQARAEEGIAQTMSLLGGTVPALPESAAYKTAAEAAGKSFDDLIGQAREMYKGVAESLGGINDPKLKARLDATKASLESLSSKQGVKAEEPAPAPTPATKPTPAASSGGDTTAVKKAVDDMYDALRKEDYDAVLSSFDFKTPGDREAMAMIFDMGRKSSKLDLACKEKFGKSFNEITGSGAGGMGMSAGMDPEKLKSMTSTDFDIRMAGDGKSANVSPKDPDAGPFGRGKMVLKNGKWLFEAPEGMGEGAAMMAMMFKPITDAMDKIADDVKSGKITSEEQLKRIAKEKIKIPGMPGLPGGGEEPNK